MQTHIKFKKLKNGVLGVRIGGYFGYPKHSPGPGALKLIIAKGNSLRGSATANFKVLTRLTSNLPVPGVWAYFLSGNKHISCSVNTAQKLLLPTKHSTQCENQVLTDCREIVHMSLSRALPS